LSRRESGICENSESSRRERHTGDELSSLGAAEGN
jgi:hypothetical protein